MEKTALNYDSPTSIKEFLEREDLWVTKRFGQNFLIDRSMRNRIVGALAVESGMHVWEIGPGIGAMTELILEKDARLTVFEIDYGFVRVLESLYASNERFAVVKGDMLKTWRAQTDRPDRIFGNLPYNAAFAIIADLLERDCAPDRMVFTLQKEAARRMAAGPGTKDYSSFSVLCASVCEVRVLFDIGASSFWPQPRVTSSVVQLIPSAKPVPAELRKGFSDFVRAAFVLRRKTLRNSLRGWLNTHFSAIDESGRDSCVLEALRTRGHRAEIRAEALSPGELFALYLELLGRSTTSC